LKSYSTEPHPVRLLGTMLGNAQSLDLMRSPHLR
jgi:hypothetical protein